MPSEGILRKIPETPLPSPEYGQRHLTEHLQGEASGDPVNASSLKPHSAPSSPATVIHPKSLRVAEYGTGGA
jgi:hypothetical protein